jgi:putative NADH-flavin reductase
MKTAIVGATGFIGSKLRDEAVSRGHVVTAITRSIDKLPQNDRIIPALADVNDIPTLTGYFRGQDAVIHSYAPGRGTEPQANKDKQRAGTLSIIAAMKAAGVNRILAVGGAGSLEVSPGVAHFDTPDFPAAYQGGARATAQIKELLRAEKGLDWTFLCPSTNIVPGERTGKFRLGGDGLLIGADGQSRISVEDYAVAMIDELENPKHTGHRFTVGY